MVSEDLRAALRERFGLETIVLRLLAASAPRLEPGAEVVYALETVGEVPSDLPLTPCGALPLGTDSDPRRMPWARLGGVTADVSWADQALAAMQRPRTGPITQVRSWNLSLLLRLPTGRGRVWLKHVPDFLRHESAVIRLVGQTAEMGTPHVLAADPIAGRVLLEEVPGTDQYGAEEPLMTRMVSSLVALQGRLASLCDSILAAGAPDWRAPALLHAAAALRAREDVRAELDDGERAALDAMVGQLPTRLRALYSCGLPDTLVHGDFHPGNHRYDGHRLVLLDWGDSGVGHPLLDMPAFLDRVPAERLGRVRATWTAAWKKSFPRADVARAAELVQPVAALRLAIVFRRFLDSIEPSERVYHREDPANWLRRAIALTRVYVLPPTPPPPALRREDEST
jgi:phosphotransferase family enzyme